MSQILDRHGQPLPTDDRSAATIEQLLHWETRIPGYDPRASVSVQNALGIPTLYACVAKIADTMAYLRPGLYEQIQSEQGVSRIRLWDNPLQAIVDKPSSILDPNLFYRCFFQDLQLYGNAYAGIGYQSGVPTELVYFRASTVQIWENSETDWVYRVTPSNKTTIEVQPENMLHLKLRSLDGGITGLSPISLNQSILKADAASSDFASKYYGTTAKLGGVIETPKQLNRTNIIDFVQWFNTFYTNGQTALLPAGLTWKNVQSQSARDADLIAAREMSAREIAMIYGVPLGLLGLGSRAIGKELQRESMEFVRYTLGPLFNSFTSELKFKFNLAENLHYLYDTSQLTAATTEERYASYQIAIANGLLSPNEARVKENLPRKEALDGHYMPSGTVRIDVEQPVQPASLQPEVAPTTEPDQARSVSTFDVSTGALTWK